MSKKSILLTIVGVVVLVIVVALFVADAKYKAVLSSPRIAYDAHYLAPETRGLILVDPILAKDFIQKNYLRNTSVPGWVLPLALPYQAAVLFDTDYVLNEMKLTAFVNDKRFGPLICAKANSVKIPQPLDQWIPDKMAVKERGVLLRKGSAKMDRPIIEKIRGIWKDAKVGAPLKAQGGHLFEMVLDNRDGGATAILLTVAASAMPGFNFADMVNEGRLGVIKTIGFMRLTGDLAADQTLKLHLTVDCSQEPNAAMIGTIGVAVETGMMQLQAMLAGRHIDLKGKSAVEGKVIEGDYTIANVDQVLKGA